MRVNQKFYIKIRIVVSSTATFIPLTEF